MPTERLSMRRIRELLRLKHENGLSSRVISASLGISKGAVGEYLRRAQVAGLSWPLPEDLTDAALERRLFPGLPKPTAVPRAEPNWAYVDRELRRTGVTRSLLWQEYRAEHPEGYGYAWFCERYETWKSRVSPTMRACAGGRCPRENRSWAARPSGARSTRPPGRRGGRPAARHGFRSTGEAAMHTARIGAPRLPQDPRSRRRSARTPG